MHPAQLPIAYFNPVFIWILWVLFILVLTVKDIFDGRPGETSSEKTSRILSHGNFLIRLAQVLLTPLGAWIAMAIGALWLSGQIDSEMRDVAASINKSLGSGIREFDTKTTEKVVEGAVKIRQRSAQESTQSVQGSLLAVKSTSKIVGQKAFLESMDDYRDKAALSLRARLNENEFFIQRFKGLDQLEKTKGSYEIEIVRPQIADNLHAFWRVPAGIGIPPTTVEIQNKSQRDRLKIPLSTLPKLADSNTQTVALELLIEKEVPTPAGQSVEILKPQAARSLPTARYPLFVTYGGGMTRQLGLLSVPATFRLKPLNAGEVIPEYTAIQTYPLKVRTERLYEFTTGNCYMMGDGSREAVQVKYKLCQAVDGTGRTGKNVGDEYYGEPKFERLTGEPPMQLRQAEDLKFLLKSADNPDLEQIKQELLRIAKTLTPDPEAPSEQVINLAAGGATRVGSQLWFDVTVPLEAIDQYRKDLAAKGHNVTFPSEVKFPIFMKELVEVKRRLIEFIKPPCYPGKLPDPSDSVIFDRSIVGVEMLNKIAVLVPKSVVSAYLVELNANPSVPPALAGYAVDQHLEANDTVLIGDITSWTGPALFELSANVYRLQGKETSAKLPKVFLRSNSTVALSFPTNAVIHRIKGTDFRNATIDLILSEGQQSKLIRITNRSIDTKSNTTTYELSIGIPD